MEEVRRLLILTEGHSNTHTAKTACSVIRYRPDEVVAVLDSTRAPCDSGSLLGVGNAPVVASLDEAVGANTLLIGIAPPGGKTPPSWRPILLAALARGMDIVSGLHDFLSDDPELAAAAQMYDARLIDVRKNTLKSIARRRGLQDRCRRIHTVGHDCSVGKMVAAFEIHRELKRRGRRAKFIATGQTGIMIEGDGAPVDCVVADFISGAAEQLVLRHQDDHEFLLVEGQGSLVHPSYSGVTLALLHGCDPHALIFCCKLDRTHVTGLDLEIPPLLRIRDLFESMASIYRPCRVIGVAVNSADVAPDVAEAAIQRIRQDFGVPTADVFRHGPAALADVVEQA